MKVKIKVDVPKGVPGVTYYGHTYKWKGKWFDMGHEYTIRKEDFNPAIMESLEPQEVEVVEEAPSEVSEETVDETPGIEAEEEEVTEETLEE